MILLIDNNDSFTYNIVELLRHVTEQTVEVRPADNLTIDEAAHYSHLIFSPGPGLPNDYPILKALLDRYDTTHPILGICLGHQAICQHYGSPLRRLEQVQHGMASTILCDPSSHLFRGINSMVVGRYHSWVADSLPPSLRLTAADDSGLIMGVEHRTKQIYGIQFHPESYITKEGKTILHRFIHALS